MESSRRQWFSCWLWNSPCLQSWQGLYLQLTPDMCPRNAGGFSWGFEITSGNFGSSSEREIVDEAKPAETSALPAGNTPDGSSTVSRSYSGLSGIEEFRKELRANYRSFCTPTLPNGTTKLSHLQPDGKPLFLTEICTRSW